MAKAPRPLPTRHEELREIAAKYFWNQDIRRQKVLEILLQRANKDQAA